MKNKTTHSVLKKVLFPFIFTILIIGCNTEYFKDRAADKSRDYIFEKLSQNVAPKNVNYIKYTYPKFLASPIFFHTDSIRYKINTTGTMENNYYTTTEPQIFKIQRFLSGSNSMGPSLSKMFTIMVIGTCYDNYWSWEAFKAYYKRAR